MTAQAPAEWDFEIEASRLADFKEQLVRKSTDDMLAEVVVASSHVANLEVYIKTSNERLVLVVLRAGYALIALREKAPHGTWEILLKEKVPALSRATIHRYMGLAKEYPDPKNVTPNVSLTDLYRKAGLLPQRNAPGRAMVAKDSKEGVASAKKLIAAADDKSGAPHRKSSLKDFSGLIVSATEAVDGFRAGEYLATLPLDDRKRLANNIAQLMAKLNTFRNELLGPPQAQREQQAEAIPVPNSGTKTGPRSWSILDSIRPSPPAPPIPISGRPPTSQ